MRVKEEIEKLRYLEPKGLRKRKNEEEDGLRSQIRKSKNRRGRNSQNKRMKLEKS